MKGFSQFNREENDFNHKKIKLMLESLVIDNLDEINDCLHHSNLKKITIEDLKNKLNSGSEASFEYTKTLYSSVAKGINKM